MTTIAYSKGILAADSAIWSDGTMQYRTKKIFRIGDGSLIGFCGTWSQCMKLLDFLKSDETVPPANIKDASALIISPNGRIQVCDSGVVMSVSRTKYLAIGTGSTIALGAMYAGASAVDAVKAAIEHDTHSRGPVTILKLRS